ncbi:MAG: 16S rRNA (guanine(527)-N(7))-methyltransferase RsmG [Candidatus Zixiibacteriota bacterium]
MKLPADAIAKLAHLQSIDDSKIAASERYCDLLIEANRRINLISRVGSVEREIERQFLLSIAILPFLPLSRLRWIDVGSGGGFPAIPLAILRPGDQFDLVESVAKKAFFLERTCDALAISNVAVRNCRIEDAISRGTLELPYDWMTAKAVTGWQECLRWAEHLLAAGGQLATYKPSSPSESELLMVCKAGFELVDELSIRHIVPDVGTRIIIMRKA